ncbi:hypothetical protein GSI_05854 [Ganoderma sinense ZZ0214-1]|uniref:DUF6534 domain-containing protein n=1 Tax=Ganoderma sinense ZZ0214-1 TaxID=1077348 RepID=A0A2G8SBL8_9APHY|nr:hypothetical protein GSI_05854 [Ganoderma sinense ZZ0214-1]
MANVENTIGAILVGALVSALLSGTVTTQAVLYLRIYGGDDYKRNNVIAFTLWFVNASLVLGCGGGAHVPFRMLDNLHIAMTFASCWIYLIRHYGDSEIYDYIPWTIALTVAITAIVTLISHCFFAHRIYMLSGCSWLITTPIVLLAFGRLTAALVSTSEMITLHSYGAFVDRVGWVFTTGLSLSTGVDVLITTTLIVLLQRSRTGFSTVTDKLIDVVTLYTFETGLLTRLNARKSLRKRTRPSDQHILPIISSLHEAQSQTQRGPGESTVRLGLLPSSSSGRRLNDVVAVTVVVDVNVMQESQLKDPSSEPSASSNVNFNLSAAAAAVRIRTVSKEEEDDDEEDARDVAAMQDLNVNLNAGLGLAEFGLGRRGMGRGWERHHRPTRAMSVPPRTTRKRTRSF